jgi:cell division septation protein DedD
MTVVGGFGGPSPTSGGTRSDVNPLLSSATQQASAPAASSTPSKPVVVNSPDAAQKPVVIAKTTPVQKPSPAAAKPAAPKKPAPAPTSTARASTGSNGYVAVLASVPVSAQSRLSALQRFADMQQQYGSVLLNKTPDIREANLGAKGTYHRLLVGPPGSRAQASALCSQLKSAGYTDCWVTAY